MQQTYLFYAIYFHSSYRHFFSVCLHSPQLPVTSNILFLNEVTTFPSFRLSKGLLLLSATFCFNLDRTFKLGSEAGD